MMTLRAEDLDPSPRGSKKKSKKSSKRSKGKVEYTVKTSADSDEESTQAAGRVEGRPRRKEESALGMVDLSIPLGSHEVIPELRHRTVPGSEVESNAGGRPLPYHDRASTQPASAPESARLGSILSLPLQRDRRLIIATAVMQEDLVQVEALQRSAPEIVQLGGILSRSLQRDRQLKIVSTARVEST